MADFLTTHATASQIESIIRDADKEICLISPYLQLSDAFVMRLIEASQSGKRVRIVYGKDDLTPAQAAKLAVLPKLELYFLKSLHAKCYFNEQRMVITSMNLYEFSEKNNREMGVLITRNRDEALYLDALKEAESFIKQADRKASGMLESNAGKFQKKQLQHEAPDGGFCIRCGHTISFNPSRPYCSKCFNKWVEFENPDYNEKVCHRCGKPELTSMNKPMDFRCFQDTQREGR